MPIEPVRLDVPAGDHRVPTLPFVRPSETPLPLVLLGHGVHLSKDDEVMQMLARGIALWRARRGRARSTARVTANAGPRT